MSLKNIVYANSLTSAVCEQAWLSCEFEQIMIEENITFRNANINVSKKDIPLPMVYLFLLYVYGRFKCTTMEHTRNGMSIYRAQIEI